MKKLLLLLFVPIIFSCNDDEDDDKEPLPKPTNDYSLVLKNNNNYQIYYRIELAGHDLTVTSQEQTFLIDGDLVAELENKQKLTGIKVKLYYECTPCSNVNGCDYGEELTIDFREQSRTTNIQIDRDMENWSQFFYCRHNITISYN